MRTPSSVVGSGSWLASMTPWLKPGANAAAIDPLATGCPAVKVAEETVVTSGSWSSGAMVCMPNVIGFCGQVELSMQPAAQLSIGVPDHTERLGTWVNVDGHRGKISAARSAPAGVRPLTSSLQTLRASIAGAEVTA